MAFWYQDHGQVRGKSGAVPGSATRLSDQAAEQPNIWTSCHFDIALSGCSGIGMATEAYVLTCSCPDGRTSSQCAMHLSRCLGI